MSIPSADHTIYSFITLCLKEQGDIAGRKEITTQHRVGWKKKKKKSDAIIDRDISLWQVYGSGAGLLFGGGRRESVGVPLHPATPALSLHLCIAHISPNCSTPVEEAKFHFGLIPWSSDLLCCSVASTPPLPPCLHAFLEVTRRTNKGGVVKQRRADRRREAVHFFTTESWVPLDRADASSYFLAALTSGLLFPLIRVQCSR